MKAAEVLPAPAPAPGPGAGAEALIREARRRQRRRYLIAGLAVLAVVASLIGGLSGRGGATGSRPMSRPRAESVPSHSLPAAVPGPIPSSVDTTVLMWWVGYPPFGSGAGPPAYADNLRAARLSTSLQLKIDVRKYDTLVARVGSRLVYVGRGGTVRALRDDLRGRTRIVGKTPFFAPSAEPGHIWLVFGPQEGEPTSVRSVSVNGGSPGPAIRLPKGTELMVEGTDAGLLLVSRGGDVELWNPGSTPRRLPDSAALGDGIDASAALVAYGTGCGSESIAANARYGAGEGYDVCRVLRVLNVVTGRLSSFRAPQGTTGWVPRDFGAVHAIAPGGSMLAAEAAIPSAHADTGRLYVLRLAGPHSQPVLVPSSTGLVLANLAWSAAGSWLFYQGPGRRMWAYQVSTGRVRASRTPCCQYLAMVSIPSPEASAGSGP